MDRPLTIAEMAMGLGPVLLPLFALVVFRVPGGRVRAEAAEGGERTTPCVLLFEKRLFWTLFCVFVGGAAAWALAEALVSAWQTGLVSLPGRRRYPRPLVPWTHAWAYLSGLASIVLGTIGSRALPRKSRWYPLYALAATFIVAAGYLLVLFSEILSSLALTALFGAFVAALVTVLWVGRKYGRPAAIGLMCFYVAGLVYANRGAI